MVQREQRKKILFINQYYYPDKASTGQLLTELCEWLAEHFDLTALVGTPSYSVDFKGKAIDSREGSKSKEQGVKVVRVFNTSFARGNLFGRLLNYLTFMLSAFLKALLLEKHDIIIVMSDPPTVNFVGYLTKKIKGGKLIQICQDVYPELAKILKQADNPLLLTVFSFLNGLSQASCDRIIAIGEGMKKRLAGKGIPDDKIEVIENWIDTDLITPEPKNNSFAQKNGLLDKFVVMHSGNIGLSQNLELLIRTAEVLSDKKEIFFVFIGDGASKNHLVKLAEEKHLENVKFLPYQEKQDLKYSLSAADIHFISLKKGLSGLIVPSKIYGIMAAGKPVIACLEKNDDVAELIEEVKFGINIPLEDPELLAKGIVDFFASQGLLRVFGDRGREAVIKRNSKSVILTRYKNLLTKIS